MIRRQDIFYVYWVFALILFLKFFVVEPFLIPTGSMIPTLLIQDNVLVSKSAYDIHLPINNIKLLKVSEPQRSDVIVFKYPNNEKDPQKASYIYIKRLIGIPGDRISMHEGVLKINGESVGLEKVQTPEAIPGNILNELAGFIPNPAGHLYMEQLTPSLRPHWVQRYTAALERARSDYPLFQRQMGRDCLNIAEGLSNPAANFYRSIANNYICEFEVPQGQYFVMGDNRDDSEDSRIWGFVDRQYLMGKALSVWVNFGKAPLTNRPSNEDFQSQKKYFNWSRFGQTIK